MAPLRDRAKQFAMRCVRLFAALPKSTVAQTLGKQFLRAGTSVAANFREASRASSDAEFIAKLGVVEQELDEALLWLELIVDAKLLTTERTEPLHNEAVELLKIVVASVRSTKRNLSVATGFKSGKPRAESGVGGRQRQAI
jgi:four helix bundle protein